DVPLGGEVDEPMVDPEVNEEVMDDDNLDVERGVTDPMVVKEAFHNHFASRFNMPTFPGIKINFPFPNRLSPEHATDIKRDVSRDEIREAVWNCGDNKSPGPDGYTFEFFKKYWGFIGPHFCEAVDYFFAKGAFSKGCNSSFIALIPKVMDAKLVNDFRPISLIGCVYKVVTKILANRMALIISNIVSNTIILKTRSSPNQTPITE
nr:RNA-directed DNA polymerase, eukaryota [Tanacetum cinerariifolium]